MARGEAARRRTSALGALVLGALALAPLAACRPRSPAGHAEPPALGTPILDPVDGARCPKAPDTDSAVFDGRTYYFCSPATAEQFRKDPEKHADRPRPAA